MHVYVGKYSKIPYNHIGKYFRGKAMLKRKCEQQLEEWLESKDALLVTGARQVGKSYLIREFGKKNFPVYVEINLFEKPEWIPVLENAKSADDLLFRISMLSDKPLEEGKTLIFFDEIQYAKKSNLITLSKFLVLNGKYRYIFSGSLLGVELTNIASWPTGYMRQFQMFPLDFEEFLIAVGLSDKVLSYLKECFEKEEKVDSVIHERILDAFYKYLLIGGMPEAVETFLSTNDLKRVNAVQEKINEFYTKDIIQYAPIKQRIHLESIYRILPQELNSKNKRFSLGEIGQGGKIKDIQDDFMWLKKAGVAIPVCNVKDPVTPLELSSDSRLVKLFHSDTGILANLLMDTNIQIKLFSNEKDINYGAIFENVVADELTAHGFSELYYYNNKKAGEVDFMIEYKGEVLPIEVKSGKDYLRHSALNNLLSNDSFSIKNAIVFCNRNVERKDKILYLPIYMIMMIKKQIERNTKITLNLSSLNIE